jgi:uncharacterized protein (DUF1697 family)
MARRYAALLRGVSPINAKMPELKRAFEAAGFDEVRTVLASGNVVFSSKAATESVLERRAETAMQAELGKAFLTIVRPIDALSRLLASDPYAGFQLPKAAKRVVTFVRGRPQTNLDLPIELGGAHIVGMTDAEVFTAYVPNPRGAVFMQLIEKTFGKQVSTRTWDSVKKIVAAA